MYNRILKRPMFKRGGSSFQAQGTGITSPFDTPRKKYDAGAWGEWEEKVREQTTDPRGDWSYAAQGFSELGNPYKESGEAKTIGEMLYAGAAGVRGSREKARELEQKGEMAILESQAAQMNAAQAHKYKLAELKIKATQEELKRIPLPRLITTIEQNILKNATPGSFEYQFSPGLATGRAHQRKKGADEIAVGVLETNRWQNIGTTQDPVWDYNADKLDASIPWYNPVEQRWHVFNGDEKGMATGDPVKSFLTVDEAIAYIKGGNQEIIEESQTLEENNAQTSESGAKKHVKRGKTYEEMQEDVIQVSDIVDKVTDPKTWEGTVGGDTRGWASNRGATTYVKKADGGRIGYAEGDVAATELDMLNNWWKNMQANDWKE